MKLKIQSRRHLEPKEIRCVCRWIRLLVGILLTNNRSPFQIQKEATSKNQLPHEKIRRSLKQMILPAVKSLTP